MDGNIIIGLIAGSCNTNGTIKNVYAKGNIDPSGNAKSYSASLAVGANNKGNIKNSYTLGKFNINADMAQIIHFGIFGYYGGDAVMSNCYYLGSSIDEIKEYGEKVIVGDEVDSSEAKTEDEMKSKDMVDLLNSDGETAWEQDTNNINDGYPILKWQAEKN